MTPPSLGSDGHCTGFPDSVGPLDWHECCVLHDSGGSDGQLLDCVTSKVPPYAEIVVIAAVALMVIFRPAYNWLQRRRLVK